MAHVLTSTDVSPIAGHDNIDDSTITTLRKIVDERYEISFDRSRLTPAADLHREAKRLLGIESDYA